MNIRVINVDQELHRQFKVAVTANGGNISQAIRELMQEYIDRQPGTKQKPETRPGKKAPGKDMYLDETGQWIKP